MMHIRQLLNKYLPQNLEPNDIKSFKVMMKHINGNDTVILTTNSYMEYIVSNPKTHYDLIINQMKIQLVNTRDIIDIHVSDTIRNKVICRIRKKMDKERSALIEQILSRKENTLDNILSKMN